MHLMACAYRKKGILRLASPTATSSARGYWKILDSFCKTSEGPTWNLPRAETCKKGRVCLLSGSYLVTHGVVGSCVCLQSVPR